MAGGYFNPSDFETYDIGGKLFGAMQAGRVDRARDKARGYLDGGDYDSAASAIMPYDQQQAEGYLSLGKRKRDEAYSSGLAPYVSSGDWSGAKQYAIENKRGADDLMRLEEFASKADDRQKAMVADKLDKAASGLYAAAQLAESGDMAGYNSAIEALGANGNDISMFNGRPYNRSLLNAELTKSKKGLEILGARNAERKLDFDERRVGATELTAQAAMARADNAGGGGGFGKAPPGYRWTQDGNQEAIPGGPAAVKMEGSKKKADLLMAQTQGNAENVLSAIGNAKKLASKWTVGAGSVLSGIPGTPAHNLDAAIDTIVANIGFDRLTEMRQSSPTGGALGAVTERELSLLQSTVASLRQSQSYEQFNQNLARVETQYRRTIAAMNDAYAEDYGAETSAPAPTAPATGRKPQAAAPGGVVKWGKDAQGNPVRLP